MTDREKLIELLWDHPCDGKECVFCERDLEADCEVGTMADKLLANGVTFAKDMDVPGKWIRVQDEMPEESGTYIAAAFDGHTTRVTFVKWQKRNKMWELTGARSYWKVTHWMPLPEPPDTACRHLSVGCADSSPQGEPLGGRIAASLCSSQ